MNRDLRSWYWKAHWVIALRPPYFDVWKISRAGVTRNYGSEVVEFLSTISFPFFVRKSFIGENFLNSAWIWMLATNLVFRKHAQTGYNTNKVQKIPSYLPEVYLLFKLCNLKCKHITDASNTERKRPLGKSGICQVSLTAWQRTGDRPWTKRWQPDQVGLRSLLCTNR